MQNHEHWMNEMSACSLHTDTITALHKASSSSTYRHTSKRSPTASFSLVISVGLLATGLVGYPCFLAVVSNWSRKNRLRVSVCASDSFFMSVCFVFICMSVACIAGLCVFMRGLFKRTCARTHWVKKHGRITMWGKDNKLEGKKRRNKAETLTARCLENESTAFHFLNNKRIYSGVSLSAITFLIKVF